MVRLTALAVTAFVLPGCATIVSGTTQSVTVTTKTPAGLAADAGCKLVNDKGTWSLPSTPGSVVIHKSSVALSVTCDKPGLPTGSAQFASHAGVASAGNLLVGGLVGIAIDANNGAAFNYPDTVSIRMGQNLTLRDEALEAQAKSGSSSSTGEQTKGASLPRGVNLQARTGLPALPVAADDFNDRMASLKEFVAMTPGGARLDIHLADGIVRVDNLNRGLHGEGQYYVDTHDSELCFHDMGPVGHRWEVMNACYRMWQEDPTTVLLSATNSPYWLEYSMAAPGGPQSASPAPAVSASRDGSTQSVGDMTPSAVDPAADPKDR